MAPLRDASRKSPLRASDSSGKRAGVKSRDPLPPSNESQRGRSEWVSGLLLVGLVVYVSGFWGQGARYLPAPLDGWAYFYVPFVKPWWLGHVLPSWPATERLALLWLSASLVLGLLVPAWGIVRCGRTLTDFGLGRPNALGCRLAAVAVVASMPFGLWLGLTHPQLGPRAGFGVSHLCSGLIMIPEHFLLSGVALALALPGRSLPQSVVPPATEAGRGFGVLRWVGLGSPSRLAGPQRTLAWLGLNGRALAAILLSGAIFGFVHLGKGPLELALSFPGGVVVAYMTLRAHSIWPALVAHWSMGLTPLGLWALLR